jgi:ankyrin repeat protein
MEYVPNEIWQQIGTFLDPNSYQTLRFSSKVIQLPKLHRLIPLLYKHFISPKTDTILRLELKFPSEEVFEFCFEHNIESGILQILKFGVVKPNDDVFFWAVRNGFTEIVKLLLEDDSIDPAMMDNDSIAEACCKGHLEIVKLLLNDLRVDPSANDQLAIRFAASEGHFEIVELLLKDPRIDPSAYDDEALIEACSEGHLRVVELLLQDERVDPSNDDNHAINAASRKGHVEIVKLLLQHEQVDFEDAFLLCCTEGQVGTCQVFLDDERVDPTMNDNHPIKEASSEGHLGIVKLLLKHPQVDPATSIRRAARYGHPKVLQELLQDPRSAGYDSFELLALLMPDGNAKVIECLLKHSIIDKNVQTLAKGCERPDVIEICNKLF